MSVDLDQEVVSYIEACSPPRYAELMMKIVKVESSGNPFAIGVVGGRLARQPANLMEAVSTATALSENGYNYSIGLTQVNKIHFEKLEWKNQIASGFDICKNISAGSDILDKCFLKARKYTLSYSKNETNSIIQRMALSCYYSGDLFLGERLGYVAKVLKDTKRNNVKIVSNVQKFNLMDYSYENQ